jgi:hypothetical protein
MYQQQSDATKARSRSEGTTPMTNKPKEPPEQPPEDSLKTLAEFTRRILQVRRDELPDKRGSTGPIADTEPCPE